MKININLNKIIKFLNIKSTMYNKIINLSHSKKIICKIIDWTNKMIKDLQIQTEKFNKQFKIQK